MTGWFSSSSVMCGPSRPSPLERDRRLLAGGVEEDQVSRRRRREHVGRDVVEDHDVHAVGDAGVRGVLGRLDLERVDVVVDEERALEEQVVLGDHQHLLLLLHGQEREGVVVERERIAAARAVERLQRRAQLVLAGRRDLGIDLAEPLAGREVDHARVDRRVAVLERQLPVRGLLGEVLDLDEHLVRRLVGDVAAHVERDDADVVAALADRQVAHVDVGQVDGREVLRRTSRVGASLPTTTKPRAAARGTRRRTRARSAGSGGRAARRRRRRARA